MCANSAGNEFPKWNPSDARASLESVRAFALKQAEAAANWYAENSKGKKKSSVALRTSSILAIVAATAFPIGGWSILGLTAEKVSISLFVGAGGFFLLDRGLGCSTAWMRYTKAQMEIRSEVALFQHKWTEEVAGWGGGNPTPAQTSAALKLLRAFTAKMQRIVLDETHTWITEFRQTLFDLEQLARARGQSQDDSAAPPPPVTLAPPELSPPQLEAPIEDEPAQQAA